MIALVAAIGIGLAAAFGAFAQGGYVSGPGTSTSDSIPAMLSNGEFVMRADAVDRIGVPALDAMNNGQASPDLGGSSHSTFILVDDRAKALKAMRTHEGRAQIIEIVEQSGRFERRG